MKKTAILCDSGADITDSEAQKLGIYVLRFPIFVDETEYEETTTLSNKELAQFLDEGKVIRTSMPSPGKLLKMWDFLLTTHDEILYIPISNKLSGTAQYAITLAKQEYKDRVFVVDSRFLTRGIVDLCKDAKQLLEQGYTAETLKKRIEDEIDMEAIFLPKNLETLKRGGRISPAIASLAGLFKIKVLLKFMPEGYLEKFDTVRSDKKAQDLLINTFIDGKNADDYNWGILHSSEKESVLFLQEALQEKLNKKIEISDILAIILAHCGNETIGVYRIKKLK